MDNTAGSRHGDSLNHDAGSSHPAGGQVHVTSDRDSFSEVWQQVVAELNSDSAIGHDPLTRQQRPGCRWYSR